MAKELGKGIEAPMPTISDTLLVESGVDMRGNIEQVMPSSPQLVGHPNLTIDVHRLLPCPRVLGTHQRPTEQPAVQCPNLGRLQCLPDFD